MLDSLKGLHENYSIDTKEDHMTKKVKQPMVPQAPLKGGQPAAVIPQSKPANTVLDLGLVAREAVVIGIDMHGQFFYQMKGTTHYNALRHIAAPQVAFFHLAHPGFHVPLPSPAPSGVQKASPDSQEKK